MFTTYDHRQYYSTIMINNNTNKNILVIVVTPEASILILTPQEQRTLTQKYKQDHKTKRYRHTDRKAISHHTWVHQKISTLSKGNQQKVALVNNINTRSSAHYLGWTNTASWSISKTCRTSAHKRAQSKGETIPIATHFLEDIEAIQMSMLL